MLLQQTLNNGMGVRAKGYASGAGHAGCLRCLMQSDYDVGVTLAVNGWPKEMLFQPGHLSSQGAALSYPASKRGGEGGCRYGPDAKTSDYGYAKVEDQQDVWQSAARIGRLIGERLQAGK